MRLSLVFLLKVFSSYISAEDINVSSDGDSVQHNIYEFGVDITNMSWLHFRVKGCNDGLLRLFPNEGEDAASMVLGGWSNDKCVMTPCSGCAQTYSIQYPFLNCDEFRPMWLNWTANTLSIGTGSYVGENVFMASNADRSFDIQQLSVSSNWNAKFVWQFYGPGGNYYERILPAGLSSRPRISTNTAASLRECLELCQTTRACRTVNYHQPSSTCHVTAEKPREQDIEVEPTWELWAVRRME